MGPGTNTVMQAQGILADPAQRAQIRVWHREGIALIDMVDRLQMPVDDALRAAITGLKPDEVAIIRDVFLAEIDRLGDGTGAVDMPLDCRIDPVVGPVSVSAGRSGNRAVAVVVPRN